MLFLFDDLEKFLKYSNDSISRGRYINYLFSVGDCLVMWSCFEGLGIGITIVFFLLYRNGYLLRGECGSSGSFFKSVCIRLIEFSRSKGKK